MAVFVIIANRIRERILNIIWKNYLGKSNKKKEDF